MSLDLLVCFRFLFGCQQSEAETSVLMESLSAAASGRFPCFSGAGIDSRRANPICEIRVCSGEDREGYARSRVSRGVWRSEFGDDGHVKYYGGKPRFDLNKEGRKEGGKAEIKKKLKMLKGLMKEEDFSEFYWMERRGGGGGGGGGEVIEGQEKPISVRSFGFRFCCRNFASIVW